MSWLDFREGFIVGCVSGAGASLGHEEGLVKYDPDKVNPEKLRRTLEQMG